jgi:Inner membrane component domain
MVARLLEPGVSQRVPWDTHMVRTVLNIIWLLLYGLWLALGYALAGLVMFVLKRPGFPGGLAVRFYAAEVALPKRR